MWTLKQGSTWVIVSKLFARRGRVMLARPRRSDLAELVSLYAADPLRVTLAGALPLEQASQVRRPTVYSPTAAIAENPYSFAAIRVLSAVM
jgi:hypothetical protein